jgi:hypothetical protein
MADGVGRHEGAIEMDAFDERIDGQDLGAIAFGLDHGRIVADADEQPVGRRRQVLPDARDQAGFAQIPDDSWSGPPHLA